MVMDWSVKHHPAFWGTKKLSYPNVPKEHAKFSESVIIGNLVIVSGCIGKKNNTDNPIPNSIAEQAFFALENARIALENAGSSMENIVKTFSLIRNLSTYGEYRKSETEYYEDHAPTLIRKPPSATLLSSQLGRLGREPVTNTRFNGIGRLGGAKSNCLILRTLIVAPF